MSFSHLLSLKGGNTDSHLYELFLEILNFELFFGLFVLCDLGFDMTQKLRIAQFKFKIDLFQLIFRTVALLLELYLQHEEYWEKRTQDMFLSFNDLSFNENYFTVNNMLA